MDINENLLGEILEQLTIEGKTFDELYTSCTSLETELVLRQHLAILVKNKAIQIVYCLPGKAIPASSKPAPQIEQPSLHANIPAGTL